MPSSPVPPARPPLPSLTGLRFVAAALVFFFHASLVFISMNPFADEDVADGFRWLFSKAGWMGVSFFFVLSGFVLTWSAKPGDTATGFWRRRLLKIFPNHIVTWAATIVLFAGTAVPAHVWLPNLFLIQSWFPDPAVHMGLNTPAWSLCSELLFYLLFPLLIGPVLRIRERALWGWAAAMAACMALVQLATDFLAPASPPAPGTDVTVWQFWFGYNFPPMRMFEFVLGMLLARLVLAGAFPRVRVLPAALLCVAGYAAALEVPFLYGLTLTNIVPISLLICAVARADADGTPTGLRSRTMQWLGEASFGFYLVQQIVLSFTRTTLMDHRTYSVPVGIAVIAAEFAASLVLGRLLLLCVERPLMQRWARPRRKQPAAPAEAPSQRSLTHAS
ncbi:acyltransferase [Streptomyces globosus]|uniref:Acyltransferase n=1 Tax=Streptomyces globosus TaxID=68209 RepID=A0A344U337_9ACTN|nr:acyltransferase [Streptomyces globosus]AXE25308.1 acyltransferase [Streptomyces globosus]